MANDGYIIVGVSDIPKDAFDNADQEAKLKQTVRSRVIEMLQAKTFIELASLDMCETIVLNTRYIQQFRILSIEQFEAKDN